ncbi:MAG TPA: osmotically inducible protein OsmC [Desulfobacteraceae bacterium]|nr:osmotically inducible protein OsmC [Desulfobacteraceae bacterium]
MEKNLEIVFPGGKRVDARINGMTVHTDQYPEEGGEGTAPEPFEVFLASIGTCAGIYALDFCRARDIPTDDLSISMKCSFDEKTFRCSKIELNLKLPQEFPDQYLKAVVRSMDLCSVKKHIMEPPIMELNASKSNGNDPDVF